MNNKVYENEIYVVSNFSTRLYKLVSNLQLEHLFHFHIVICYLRSFGTSLRNDLVKFDAFLDKHIEQCKILNVMIFKLL